MLFFLTSTFTIADWVYLSQHLLVLGIALTRSPPDAQEHSLLSSTAVVVSYAYPYAQVVYTDWAPGFTRDGCDKRTAGDKAVIRDQ